MTWLSAVLILAVVTAFALGKLHERIEWNKLIENGIIQKPKQRNYNG